MKCPHCLVEFAPTFSLSFVGEDHEGKYFTQVFSCHNQSCLRKIIYLVHVNPNAGGDEFYDFHKTGDGLIVLSKRLIRPRGTNRNPIPPQVPGHVAEDYKEACLVLDDSPKASAALSRRCLQNILHDKGIRKANLSQEIQYVLDHGNLPSYLAETIDAVRNIGNFAAHPGKSESTGELVEVLPGEAEWNLEVIELLFDFYYVQPALIQARRDALNAKLNDANQRAMK